MGIIKMTFPDYNIVFVDTPGFDDTKRSDSDILKIISDWLKITYVVPERINAVADFRLTRYERKLLLSGILYFHRISDTRMGGTPLRNLRMFEGLCGKSAFKNVVIATTMWDKVDEGIGAILEDELKNNYWNAMIDRDSTTGRFLGTRDSAFRLIAPFLEAENNRTALLIQRELVDFDLRLGKTRAGQILRAEIKRSVKQQERSLDRMGKALKHPDNAALTEEYEQLKKTHGSLLQQMADLEVPVGRQLMNTIANTFSMKR
jgi:hypothetical protein